MEIKKDEYDGFVVNCKNALVIKINDIDNGNDVITAMVKHFTDVPERIDVKIIFLGILDTGVAKRMTLNGIGVLIYNLVKCTRTDEGISSMLDDIVVTVVHDEGVFNFIIGKLNYTFDSETLISNQVGHA